MILVSDVKPQYAAIKEEIDAAVQRVLDSGWFILGAEVEAFEREFAAYNGNQHAVGVGSGTDALELALRAVGVGPGDEVITTTHTATFSVLAISQIDAIPVLADVDPETGNIDPSDIEKRITARTRAIMPVHLYGQAADMDPILEIGQRHNVPIVEDCAQAHGAKYKGRQVGTMGAIGGFSFYPSKNLGAYGDGGLVVTDDAAMAETVRMLRNGGQQGRYNHVLQGVNSRLDELQAAILRVKLRHLDEWNLKRGELACRYHGLFANVPQVQPIANRLFSASVYHLYVVRVPADQRDAFMEHLKQRGIATMIHYPTPVHLQLAYAGLELGPGSYSCAEKLASEIVSLPLYPELTREQQEQVASAAREFFSK
ncbi:MAG: erythromycin biosynthesis sensory transduction protein eryC1 [Candidatus Chloroheliales bacterium]|nr:MAG: erythromycin biosynthesis sensory transduction protein eryC1 [Chloroflexota bacterium]